MLKDVVGRVGRVDVCRVFDSRLIGETMQAFFPDFDREALRPHEHWLCPHHYDRETGHFEMPVCSWVFQVAGKTIVVDTCVGNCKQRPAHKEMHLLDTRYLERLRACGVRPEDVDFVLCSHLHADHVGWNTRLDNGRWVPTFPNASYVINRAEYLAREAETGAPDCPISTRLIFEDSIYPVVAAGKAILVDGVHELLEGLLLRPAPGHSPGHIRIELTSDGVTGVFAGDLVHSPVQVPMWTWSTRVCWNREMAARSRRDLLDFCVAEQALLLPAHFVAPHVGRIREDGSTFAIDLGWQ